MNIKNIINKHEGNLSPIEFYKIAKVFPKIKVVVFYEKSGGRRMTITKAIHNIRENKKWGNNVSYTFIAPTDVVALRSMV